MNNLQITEFKVKELNFQETQELNGGGCSFAYDVGTTIRIIGFLSNPLTIFSAVRTYYEYEANCQ